MSVLTETDRNHVRYLRLNRPEVKNALNAELGWAIVEAAARAARDDEVRVIALTAEGSAFCSGLDLVGGAGEDVWSPLTVQEQALDDKGWVGRFLPALRFDTDKPVVVGLNGVAVGAGAALAFAGDIRIAAASARLHPGYVRAGATPDGGLSWTLPQLVGHERAMRFLLESEFVTAHEALAQGLVGEVVADDRLPVRLEEYCEALAARAPLAVRRTKRFIARAPMITDIDRLVADEVRAVMALLDTADSKEAVAALMERRDPTFQGR